MIIRHFFTLITMVLILMTADFVCPTVARTADEFRLRLNMRTDSQLKPAQVQPSPSERMTVLDRRRIPGKAPRQRNVELSSQHLVVIGLDENDREITRAVVMDPRLMRSEIFSPSGEWVSSELTYRENAEFLLVFSDDPRLRKLKIYHPNWTGNKFVLELIGETQLP